jgi:hypothetical protein
VFKTIRPRIHQRELCFDTDGWPGNIRELQNFVERSVILLSGDTFWIDEVWLSNQQPTLRGLSSSLTETLENQEKKIIEAALAERIRIHVADAGGRTACPSLPGAHHRRSGAGCRRHSVGHMCISRNQYFCWPHMQRGFSHSLDRSHRRAARDSDSSD